MKMKYLIFAVLSLSLMACSSNDDSATTSSEVVNPMTSSFGTLSTKLSQIDFIQGESGSAIKATAAPNFSNAWEVDTNWPDQACSGQSCSLISTKDYMGNEIDAESKRDNGSDISVVGRVQGAMKIMCAMGVALGNSSGYPENTGAEGQTFSFSPSVKAGMKSQCNFQDVDDIPDGTSMTIVIEDAEDTTNFDKKATIDLSEMNGGEQVYYFRASSTSINVATAETYTYDSIPRASRTVVYYDVTNDILKGEYVSGPQAGSMNDTTADNDGPYASFYRLFYDANEDNGYILSARGMDDDETAGEDYRETLFVLAGKPNTTGGQFSLSLESENELGGAGEFRACVNGSNGNIAIDGSLCSASATALAGGNVSGSAFLGTFLSGYNGADFASVSASTTLNFSNETDVLTANPSTEP